MGLLDFLNNYRTKQEQPKQEEKLVNGYPVQVVEIGTSGTEIYSGYINEEYLSELRGRPWADKIDMMRRSDPNIKMVLNALKSPIKSANWIVTTKDDSDMAAMQKKLIEKALFEDINKSFTKMIGECLTFVDFGFSVFEVTHQNKLDDPELGSYTTLRSISWRSQRTIERWNVDKDGSLKSITQIADGDLGTMVDLDSRFLLHFAPDQEGDNYEGVSVLRSMYGNWLRKNSFLKLLAAGIEKYAIPTPVMQVPDGARGKPEYLAAEKALKCYVSNQANYLMIPNGWELSFNNVSFDSQKIRETIDFENKEMVNSILASFLLLGQNGAGSLALSGTLSDFFAQTITYISDHISEQFQRKIITPLIKMNFGDVPSMVEIKCDSLEDKIDASWAQMVQSLTASGMISSDEEIEKYVREKLKLPAIAEETEQPELEATQPAPEQTDIQKQALNGAQVASLVNIIQSVAAGLMPRDSAVEMIKLAFQVDQYQADQILGSAGQSFKIQPQQISAPQPTLTASDANPKNDSMGVSLAEKKKPKKRQDQNQTADLIRNSANEIKQVTQTFLKALTTRYLYSVIAKKKAMPDSKIYNVPNETSFPSADDYKNLLNYVYLKITANAKTEFKNLVLKKKKTLSEFRLAMTREQRIKNYDKQIATLIEDLNEAFNKYDLSGDLGDYADVVSVRNKISELSGKANEAIIKDYEISYDEQQRAKAKVETIVNSQIADIQKASDLQYQSSATITDIPDAELYADMSDATDKMIDNNIVKGADIQASQLVNESRYDAADDIADETDEQIVSWTYIAEDDERTTDLCRELNGWTFANNDPNIDRFTPPMHWNCRSYLQVNLASFVDNPPVDKGEPKLSDKALGQINLSEQKTEQFELAEYQGRKVELNKPFRTPDAKKKFGVYVKNEKGNVILLRFGDSNMDIKRDDMERRKNFRARHQCDSKPANKWEARYWSCKFWSDEKVGDLI